MLEVYSFLAPVALSQPPGSPYGLPEAQSCAEPLSVQKGQAGKDLLLQSIFGRKTLRSVPVRSPAEVGKRVLVGWDGESLIIWHKCVQDKECVCL